MKNQESAAKQAVVIGGSLAGLFAGLLLRSIRRDVDIYERSPRDLDSRGGGIVLHPRCWRRSAEPTCTMIPRSVSRPRSGCSSTAAAASRGAAADQSPTRSDVHRFSEAGGEKRVRNDSAKRKKPSIVIGFEIGVTTRAARLGGSNGTSRAQRANLGQAIFYTIKKRSRN
jgi:2-polyprenyl-6-methoxyphenol hydroxylase-like FAD-dependent oxidoreductase